MTVPIASSLSPTQVSFEERYGDDSGVEFAVRFDAGRFDKEIELVSQGGDSAHFPIDRINWLVDRLCWIRDHRT